MQVHSNMLRFKKKQTNKLKQKSDIEKFSVDLICKSGLSAEKILSSTFNLIDIFVPSYKQMIT